jgi:peptidoglycan/LPS O-acetylase OafA/YrhL
MLLLFLKKDASLDNGDSGDAVYWNTISQADAFAIGGLISVIVSEGKIKFHKWFVYASTLFFLAYGAIMCFVQNGYDANNYFFNLGYPSANVFNLAPVFSYTIANLFFASCLFFLVDVFINNKRNWVNGFLSSKVMVQIGRVSYGMYIYHWAIMMLLKRYVSWSNSLLNFPIYLIVVFAVAYLSYILVESFFLKWKLRFA